MSKEAPAGSQSGFFVTSLLGERVRWPEGRWGIVRAVRLSGREYLLLVESGGKLYELSREKVEHVG